jgi:hypothetical protein
LLLSLLLHLQLPLLLPLPLGNAGLQMLLKKSFCIRARLSAVPQVSCFVLRLLAAEVRFARGTDFLAPLFSPASSQPRSGLPLSRRLEQSPKRRNN